MLRRIAFFIFGIAFFAGAIGLVWLDRELNRPLVLAQDQLSEEGSISLVIEQGDTLSQLVKDLADKGVLPNPLAVKLFVKATGRGSIRAGEYRLYKDDTPLGLLDKLERGEVVDYRITFPEGWTLREWLALLAAETHIEHETIELSDSQIAERLGIEYDNPEGWFSANTYYFSAGNSDLDILAEAYQRMQEVLARQWQERAVGLPYQSPYEALIMASIVERETGVAEERAQIAGVFVRRLQKPMRLQTDPTVIYGLGERYRGNITRSHLREATPYNTYIIDGLPPGPIANPGDDAIRAALHPAGGDKLYFVAKGDGYHQFSATLAEHQKAVQRYQINRKRRTYRSSPVEGKSGGEKQEASGGVP